MRHLTCNDDGLSNLTRIYRTSITREIMPVKYFTFFLQSCLELNFYSSSNGASSGRFDMFIELPGVNSLGRSGCLFDFFYTPSRRKLHKERKIAFLTDKNKKSIEKIPTPRRDGKKRNRL